jgi:cytochrome c-type biogenesis protein CcmH/NrfG
MFEDWIVVICGVIVVIIVAVITLLQLRGAERRMHENTHKLRVYTDLLNAITELNLAGGDSYKMDIAKKNLALTLNRLNLVGSIGVLKSINDLLDFLN